MTDTTYYLTDHDAMAPDELGISANMSNEKAIARWWADVKLYVAAMQGLDRTVLLVLDIDDATYRLSSHPDEMPR